MIVRLPFGFKNIDRVFKYLRKKESVACSWCGKAKPEVGTLIGGPQRQFICDSCVGVCNDNLKSGRKMVG